MTTPFASSRFPRGRRRPSGARSRPARLRGRRGVHRSSHRRSARRLQAWAAAEFLRVQVPAVQGPGGLLGASSQAGEEFVAAIEERRRNLLPLEEREPFDDGPAAQVANIGINAHAVYRAPCCPRFHWPPFRLPTLCVTPPHIRCPRQCLISSGSLATLPKLCTEPPCRPSTP